MILVSAEFASLLMKGDEINVNFNIYYYGNFAGDWPFDRDYFIRKGHEREGTRKKAVFRKAYKNDD